MADLTDPTPTPNAARLAAELKALHARREREPLPPADEARYTELWAWWQASAEFAAAPADELPPGDSAELGAERVPDEWLAAFDDDATDAGAAGDRAATSGEPAASGVEPDLLSEWEAWQAKQSRGDPFDLVADELGGASGSAYEDVMSARAEVLGSDVSVGELAEDPAPELGPVVDSGESSGATVEAAPSTDGDAAQAPVVAPEAPAAPPGAVPAPGSRRVVIHLSDGQARRGQVADVELSGDTFDYIAAGGAIESVPRSEVRTVFFMRAPGVPAPRADDGTPVRVLLRDGRELVGRSPDHASDGDGFTLLPDETLTSAALVWIARSAVRSVSARG